LRRRRFDGLQLFNGFPIISRREPGQGGGLVVAFDVGEMGSKDRLVVLEGEDVDLARADNGNGLPIVSMVALGFALELFGGGDDGGETFTG
jgi:hypothetical protein